MEAQSISEIQPLLAESSAIHSVVLLPQDTPRMAGCYGQPPPHPLLECVFVCMDGRRGEERAKKKEEAEYKEENRGAGSDSNWQ